MAGSAVPQRLGKYEVLREIGRGGFSSVYLARDVTLDRPVAIKILAQHLTWERGFVERFRREARAVANLRHTNIVTVHEIGEAEGQLYIAMEYIEGQSLAELIDLEGALAPEQTLAILEQVADALDYAHSRGILHRDIKPANIMVEGRGQKAPHVTLMDFGLVKAIEGSQYVRSTMHLMGTPEYMSPEHAEGRDLDESSDLYSLGIVAYKMCTGHLPFSANTPLVVLRFQAEKAPPLPRTLNPRLSPEIEQVLLKALSKSSSERYQSAHDLVEAFRDAMQPDQQARWRRLRSGKPSAGRPTPNGQSANPRFAAPYVSAPPSTGPRSTAPARRPPVWLWGLMGAAALALIVGITWVLVRPLIGGDSEGTPTAVAEKQMTHTQAVLPTATPKATATDTPSPTVTNTPSPTATDVPKPTKTLLPTPTPVHTPTPVPVDTPTAAPDDTPTPVTRWLTAPTLIAPANGASFSGWNAEVILQWSPVAGIAQNEYYVVSIPYDDLGGVAEYWRRETSFQLPSHFSVATVGFADRHYNWSVQVRRCTTECAKVDSIDPDPWYLGVRGVEVGSASAERVFYWHSDIPGSKPKPYGYGAGVSVPPSLSGEHPVSTASPYARAFSVGVVTVLVLLLAPSKRRTAVRVRAFVTQFLTRLVQ